MKKLFLLWLVIAVCFICFVSYPRAKTPYEIVQSGPLDFGSSVIQVWVDVPKDANKVQLQSWCNEIVKSESRSYGDDDNFVIVEFFQGDTPVKGASTCYNGKLDGPRG